MHPQCIRAQQQRRRQRRLAELDRHMRLLYKRRRRYFPCGTYVELCLFSPVWERDGGTCQICGRPIDLLRPKHDAWGPTIDHIIPVSLCGSHTYDNLQLSHKICNARKGGLIRHGKAEEVEPDEEGLDRPWNDWVRGGTPAWYDPADSEAS